MKLLTQPYLLTLNPSNEMNILWVQSEKTDGFVEFGYTENMGCALVAGCYEINGFRKPFEDGTYSEVPYEHTEISVWQYVAKIENLEPGKTVYYRCNCGGEYTKTYFFHTAPRDGGAYRFAQISDLQALTDCNKTVYQIGCFHPDFISFSGDANFTTWRLDQWFDTGEQWQSEESKTVAFFPCMQQENGARLMQYAPLFFCPGNHEPDFMKCGRGIPVKEAMPHWCWSIFMKLFRPLYPQGDYGVNGVSYDHSHVYERYYAKGTHYIEAAYLSITFACEGEKPHPSGRLPIVEDNSRRSFVILERKPGGIFATGYYANDDGEPIEFDHYQIADEEGISVAPIQYEKSLY